MLTVSRSGPPRSLHQVPGRRGNPPRRALFGIPAAASLPDPPRTNPSPPRPSRGEVERRIAEAQLWIAQRLPLIRIRDNAAQNWGVTNTKTVSRYLNLAR